MTEIEKIIRKYLKIAHMMQIATIKDGQPWCCTVYFVSDENLNLYWISIPERRHSQEILENEKVAAAIPIKHIPGENVIGIQVEGDAKLVQDLKEIKRIAPIYADRYGRSKKWCDDFIAGKTKHKLYRVTPRLFVLFDEETFPTDPRKEWKPLISQ